MTKQKVYTNFKYIGDISNVDKDVVEQAIKSFCEVHGMTKTNVEAMTTAVMEAVNNVLEFAYPNKTGVIRIEMTAKNGEIKAVVMDKGVGIKNIAKAEKSFYTTAKDKSHSGMGLPIIKYFTDAYLIEKNKYGGITVSMLIKDPNIKISNEAVNE